MVCEPFTQWVIEDHFPQGRPAWERTGAELVGDVRPYEDMKLRLLNGSHSSIAYLGQLAGWQTVAEAIAVPELARAHRRADGRSRDDADAAAVGRPRTATAMRC